MVVDRPVTSSTPVTGVAVGTTTAAGVPGAPLPGAQLPPSDTGSNNGRASSSSNGSWNNSTVGFSAGPSHGQQQQQQQPDASARVACEKCGRTFKNKSNLKIHMLTHSGIKPFGCKIEGCRTGFTTKQCLQFHYRKAHGLADEEMPKIEREIPYTLSAYSGGMCSDDSAESGEGGTRIRKVRR